LNFFPSRIWIPDLEAIKAPDPGSATLHHVFSMDQIKQRSHFFGVVAPVPNLYRVSTWHRERREIKRMGRDAAKGGIGVDSSSRDQKAYQVFFFGFPCSMTLSVLQSEAVHGAVLQSRAGEDPVCQGQSQQVPGHRQDGLHRHQQLVSRLLSLHCGHRYFSSTKLCTGTTTD
jgi:hypothetical protein